MKGLEDVLTARNRLLPWILVAVGLVLRVAMALFVRKAVDGDMDTFLIPWVSYIRDNGVAALADEFNNYAPAYIYFLALIAWTGLPEVACIRLLSGVFDYVCAYFVGRMLRTTGVRVFGKSDPMPWALAIVPLMPTLLINSCYWGQCDAIYGAFAIASVAFAIEGRQWRAAVALGLAFAFKLQAVFVVPLFFALWLKGRMELKHFLIVPLVYLLTTVPEIIIGRDPWMAISVYLHQASQTELNMGFGGLFAIFEAMGFNEGNALKMAGCAVVVVAGLSYGFWLRKREWGENQYPMVALVGAVCAVWLLPGMHERYMFVGDLLGVLCAASLTGRARWAALAVPAVSFYCYMTRTRLNDVMPLWIPSIVLAVTAVALFLQLRNMTSKAQ